MTTIKIDSVEISIEALEKLGFVRKEKVGRYIPEIGESYFTTNHEGIVERYTNKNDGIDKYSIAASNCYRTKEEAEQARDKQLATVRILDRLAELSVGFDDIKWTDKLQGKCSPQIRHGQEGFCVASWESHQYSPQEYYTTNPDAWPTIIKEMENDLKLMMGIKE